ncbi:GNAT family N-acetyltransferase [Brevibacterium casei]|uniref:Ribosomal-protein-alanine acetyltransferase n=1 Tax=Brevibacterium casei S18 TaxID=1229781 RepID=K9B4D0_9MICO|nr:GNAT family N-acetyltransferase [Brevibacterium casei]EKU48665.1 ribosomal-protein-alanine acetyltransferase [Brevibacterium casei S18]MCT1446744.1 GNAT family N-acetyltransferase [Brevibacterium casei]MCT1765840.1 GNAT family N-acetyltransferase [Brevibacterium casei]MCT2358044.1 GNAT family N-acetyltransferase [Brevibacterium casei]QQT70676.1 GNAT family N-acetyltransferase [Brevibacterium casei]
MTVSVRELPWWELSEVAAADARIFGATAWTLPYYWAVAAQPGTAMFVARDEGTGDLAGWVVMSAVGSEADVMTIATTEAARGRGVGRTLLLAGIDWADEAGAGLIHLEVADGNAPALGLYRSLGFEEWGRRPDYYPGADAVLMRRSVR